MLGNKVDTREVATNRMSPIDSLGHGDCLLKIFCFMSPKFIGRAAAVNFMWMPFAARASLAVELSELPPAPPAPIMTRASALFHILIEYLPLDLCCVA